MKRKWSILLLCIVLLTLTVQPAFAANHSAPAILYQLMVKFPHLAYWNHVGSPYNNPDGVTDQPCPTHSGCSWVPGACTCNSFCNAIQCMGFAYKAAYDIVGSDPRGWDKSTVLDASKLRVGDVIRYRGNRHSLCVTGVKGNVISFVDANWLPMCQIRWAAMDLADMPSFTYVLHSPDNNLKNTNIDFYLDAFGDGTTPTLPAADPTKEVWVTNGNLNLRAVPGLSGDKVSLVPQGTRITVTDKKLKDDYLWGKTSYGNTAGWIALDYCLYRSGTPYAPTFVDFSHVHPLNESFQLKWKAVAGADSYTLTVLDEDDKVVKTVKTTQTSCSCKLTKTGTYSASVASASTHATTWVLDSTLHEFAVRKRSDIDVQSLALKPASLELCTSETATLTLGVTPYCANLSLAVKSSNPAIATISNNVVTANGLGLATITYTDRNTGVSAACKVSVVPTAPQNLRQNRAGSTDRAVALKWSKVAGAQGYFVYRQKADGAFAYIATTNKNAYLDTGRTAGQRYVYKVKAYIMSGTTKLISTPSAAAAGIALPAAVTDLSASASGNRITVKWGKSATADFYIVFRHTAGTNGFQRVTTVTGTKYSETLQSGTRAAYKIRAVKTVGGVNYISPYSNSVVVTAG
ncbi:MAG: Ig-like domain-containing protein [Clostridia bacterium]|nr:Ig-like domain-containing protein [Clostridia bacterium]